MQRLAPKTREGLSLRDNVDLSFEQRSWLNLF